MNPTRRGTPDFLLLFLTLALVAFGLIMVFSASSMTAAYKWEKPFYFTETQAIAVSIGLIAMFLVMNIHIRKLHRWVKPGFMLTLILLILVQLIGSVGEYGGRSWIPLGPFNLQPSEFAKIAIILYLAALISKKGERSESFSKGLLPALIVTAMPMLLIVFTDLGSALILMFSAITIIAIGGANLKHIFAIVGGLMALAAIAISLLFLVKPDSYQLKRLTTYLDPWQDPLGDGFQIINSLYALGNGGFSGTGLGQSIQKLHFLTQAHNDFIFAIIGEELGFVGSSVFLLIYVFFIWRGIIVSLRCPDRFAQLLGVGIMSLVAIQALVNLGGVTNTIPLTGVTLPLISYGGSSIIATLIAMGIVLSISREQQDIKPTQKKRMQAV